MSLRDRWKDLESEVLDIAERDQDAPISIIENGGAYSAHKGRHVGTIMGRMDAQIKRRIAFGAFVEDVSSDREDQDLQPFLNDW